MRKEASDRDRVVKELAAAGITDMVRANAYLRQHYLPAFNAEFARPPLGRRGQSLLPVRRPRGRCHSERPWDPSRA